MPVPRMPSKALGAAQDGRTRAGCYVGSLKAEKRSWAVLGALLDISVFCGATGVPGGLKA